MSHGPTAGIVMGCDLSTSTPPTNRIETLIEIVRFPLYAGREKKREREMAARQLGKIKCHHTTTLLNSIIIFTPKCEMCECWS